MQAVGGMMGSALAGSPLGKMVGAFGGDPSLAMGQAPAGNPFSGLGGGGAPTAASAAAPPVAGAPGDTSPYVDPRVSAPNAGKPPMVSQPMQAPTVAPTQGGGGNMTNPKAEMTSYIVQAAQARGIDPRVMLKVANSEGLQAFDPSKPDGGGDEGSSFGPFQLHYANMSKSMPHPGLGDEFTKATGLDARDPSTWKQQVDFSADYAAQHGWGSWMGAKAVGLGNFDGIGPNAKAVGVTPGQPSGDVMSVKDGMGHSGAPMGAAPEDDHLMTQALAILSGKVPPEPGATGPEASPTENFLSDVIGRSGAYAAQAASAYQGATTGPATPAIDTGAQDVANAGSATMQRRMQGSPNQQQRKLALSARVHNRKASA